MPKKGTKFYSVLNNKCPRCHKGDFFINTSPFKIKNNLKTYDNCSNCNLKYMLEPSFFYGAMYISYAITVAIAIAVFIISYWIGTGFIGGFVSIIVILVLLMPITMRLSRILYINMFIHYEKDIDPKQRT